jgi:exosortase
VPGNTGDAFSFSPQWRQASLYSTVGLVLALLALWPTVFDLTQQWSSSIAYQYAWLVLPVFIYVAGWYHRDNILAMTPRSSWAGLPVLAAAIALWSFAHMSDIKLGTHIALVMVMQGIALCALGGALYRRWLPLMLLLFFMVPCGDLLQPLLRDLTLKWVEWFAVATGLPHTVDGYYLLIGEHEYEVLDACSGLAFFTLGGFLGYSFGLLLFRSFARVVGLAALGATLGIMTNALRVWLIVALDQLRETQMDLAGHTDIQWLVWLASLALLLYLANKLTHDNWAINTENSTGNQTLPWPAARFSPIVAGVLLVVSTSVVRGIG